MTTTDSSVLALIQARMSSTRLPGKVLREMQGRPMLQVMLERLSGAENIETAVLTSTDSSDDPVAEFAESHGVPLHRGPLEDVLRRYVGALDRFEPEIAMRLTGDCPFADARLVEEALQAYEQADLDDVPTVGVCNHLHEVRTDPLGYVAEVFTPEELRWLDSLQLDDDEREHVTLGFKRRDLLDPYAIFEEDYSEFRWTVDWEEDFEYMDRMFDEIGLGASAETAVEWSLDHPHPKSHSGG